MSRQYLLAICIPTYDRPNDLIENLELIDIRKNGDVLFVVSSNKFQSELIEYVKAFSNVKYFQHEENQGFTFNLGETLRHSTAEFSLILSDEDFISQDNLDRLKMRLARELGSRSVLLVPTHDKFSLSSLEKMIGAKLTYTDIAATNPHIPTYMSGFVFPTGLLSQESVEHSFSVDKSNAYPFLLLRNHLLQNGFSFEVLDHVQIQRGADSEFRDPEANFVNQDVDLQRVNYFLRQNRACGRKFSLVDLQTALLVYAQILPGLLYGFLSLQTRRSSINGRHFQLSVREKSTRGHKVSRILAGFAVIASHFYRRLRMLKRV